MGRFIRQGEIRVSGLISGKGAGNGFGDRGGERQESSVSGLISENQAGNAITEGTPGRMRFGLVFRKRSPKRVIGAESAKEGAIP